MVVPMENVLIAAPSQMVPHDAVPMAVHVPTIICASEPEDLSMRVSMPAVDHNVITSMYTPAVLQMMQQQGTVLVATEANLQSLNQNAAIFADSQLHYATNAANYQTQQQADLYAAIQPPLLQSYEAPNHMASGEQHSVTFAEVPSGNGDRQPAGNVATTVVEQHHQPPHQGPNS